MCRDKNTNEWFLFHCWHYTRHVLLKKKIKGCAENKTKLIGVGVPIYCCRCGKEKIITCRLSEVSTSIIRDIKETIYL